ncbi:MAG: alpha/beta hydrolase [Gammaproteobacteria bacterium]|nr:alpha/beta hydrolase [Gammaproteobacteria bacterium]
MATWIFLRGLIRESRHWEGFLARFSTEFPGARLIAVDLPGNGRRCEMTSPTRIAGMTQVLRENLPLQGPVRILALSMGAMVALDWAARFPKEIEALVLLNTSLGGISPWYRRLRPRAAWQLLSLPWRGAIGREALILELTSRRHGGDAALAREWARYARESPVHSRNALRQLLAAARFRMRAAPSCPVLLLAGAKDGLVDPACSRDLAKRWGAELRMHPDAGHDLSLDEADWVLAQLRAWLAGLKP